MTLLLVLLGFALGVVIGRRTRVEPVALPAVPPAPPPPVAVTPPTVTLPPALIELARKRGISQAELQTRIAALTSTQEAP
jgi:hypothetical protein